MRTFGRMGLAVLTAAIALSGCSLAGPKEDPKPELLKPVKQKAELVDVSRGDVSNALNGIATITPRDIRYVQSLIDGTAKQVLVKPGDTVRPGDVLIELDPFTLESDILNQQLKLEQKRADWQDAKEGGDPDTIKVAAMDVGVEQMRLDQLLDMRDKLKIKAPVGGVIGFIDPGIVPNAKVAGYQDLIEIFDPGDLVVTYMTSLTNTSTIRDIEPNTLVELDYKGQTVTGKVIRCPMNAPVSYNQAEADKNARTLVMGFDSMPSGATYGENVPFRLTLSEKKNVLKIPRVALRSYQGRDFVQVMDGETRKEIDVQKGLVAPTEVEIVKGLKEGQKVILNN